MSQPVNPRAQRSVAGMVVALVVAAGVAGGWYFLGRPSEDARPVKTVDWAAWVQAGRTDQDLLLFAPTKLPEGWRATSVTYAGGSGARWHLGLLTDAGKYVGIEESRASTSDLAEQYVDEDAVRGEDVMLAGETWQTWTDAGGDYAVVRSIELGGQPYESVLVVGSAPASTINDFVESLESGSVRLAG